MSYAVMVYTNIGSRYNPIMRWITDTVHPTEAEAVWESLTRRVQANNTPWDSKVRVVEYHSYDWEMLVL